MRVLILGFSRIVQRKLLPALVGLDAVDAIEVASRRGMAALDAAQRGQVAHVYDDFARALAESQADVVYVSSVNSEHLAHATAALEAGKHVVVDKPSATDLAGAEALAATARAAGRGLAESTVWAFHPRIERARALLAEADASPNHLVASFSFPPLPAENFRNDPALGGGAWLDLSRYASSPGRLFFGAEPERVHCVFSGGGSASAEEGAAVETGLSLLLGYPGGRTLTGHFGFDTEYRNALVVHAPGLSLELDRVFTPPPGMELAIQVAQANQRREEPADAGDCFAGFLEACLADFAAGRYEPWIDELLSDARAAEAMRRSAQDARGR